MRVFVATVLAVGLAAPSMAQLSFDNVESRTGFGTVREGDDGQLVIGSEIIRFEDGGRSFELPPGAVTELYYSRVSGRRLKSAIFISPVLFLAKGRKHYVTVSFSDGVESGAVELKLDKKNYRGVLRSLEMVTGRAVRYDQEGIKDTEQDIAVRDVDETRSTIDISSTPVNAEITIDGAFNGSAPRLKTVEPGEYVIRVTKPGYEAWERTIALDAGESVNIHAELARR